MRKTFITDFVKLIDSVFIVPNILKMIFIETALKRLNILIFYGFALFGVIVIQRNENSISFSVITLFNTLQNPVVEPCEFKILGNEFFEKVSRISLSKYSLYFSVSFSQRFTDISSLPR